ncbi:MAG: RNA polymerase sigma factor [Phocaeicola sp.]|uniref:RNA polymerase sigma factor n=1 Tax=Phocaeicola sp. TaxID=2773926 RepID=UPI003FA00068
MEESQIKWEQFVSGDDNAFAWIYAAYVQRLFHYGVCFCPDKELVKDCIQSLFTDLFKNRFQTNQPKNIKVYLFSALKNNLFKEIQRKQMREGITDDIHFSLDLSAEEQYIADEKYLLEKKKVSQLLSLLTPRQKEIIYFRFIQEMSMDEICSIMNLNYQSAQNLIQRSLNKLREQQKDLCLLFVLSFFFH